MNKFYEIWGRLPKTGKVFLYIAVSTILAELAIELANLDQTFVVRILAQIINLVIVLLQDTKTEITKRLG